MLVLACCAAAPTRTRSFHAEFAANGKATLCLRVTLWPSDADGAAPPAAAAAAAAKPSCILDGEFTAVRRT